MSFFSRVYQTYVGSHIPFFAAALAYYALFSLMPLLFLLVGVFGFILSGNAELESAFLSRLVELTVLLFPTQPEIAQTLVNFLTKGAVPITFASLLVLLWASSNFFAALAYALGVIFGKGPPHLELEFNLAQIITAYDPYPLRRWSRQALARLGVLRGRIAALMAPLLLGLAIILLALLGLGFSFMLRYLPPGLDVLRGGLELILPILGGFMLFFFTYALLPVPAPKLGASLLAAAIAALAWEGMRLGLPLLIPRNQYEVIYGPIAGFLLALVGFYLTMWILLGGAVVAKVLSEGHALE
ncbi:MAG: ribonuclease BN [Meiothermus sp.]